MRITWKKDTQLVDYDEALSEMERIVNGITLNLEQQTIWFLEHPDIYTGGSSANKDSLLDPRKFPVYETGRGGDYTYHGPGQRVIYLMLDLKKIFAPHEPDLRKYIYYLEQIIIDSLKEVGISGERREGRIGIWVHTKNGEKKIAAIGVRVRKWVTYHGIAININPNLSNFDGIVPCGISEYGVTSIQDLGKNVDMEYFDNIIKSKIKNILKV